LFPGATENVSSGGTASGTVLSSGGREIVSAGGFDRLSFISSGGLQFILSAGTVSGGTVISGATTIVSSGGIVAAGLTLSGGTAVISGLVAAGQTVTFAGSGGDLALFNLPAFAAAIGGFGTGDKIDLGSFAFSSAATPSFTEAASHTSGTLSVINGVSQAHLTLLGSYVTSNFGLANDGTGGTLVKFA
jgi:autotransporter passenger strand-loop-strand repeat protein